MKRILLLILLLPTFADAQVGIIYTIAGNGTSGYSGDGGPATAAILNNPTDVYKDNGGNLYIADQRNQRIRKINTLGIISTVAGNGTPGYTGDGAAATLATLKNPNSVAVDAVGNIYIADESNNVIRKVDVSGIITTVVTGLSSPTGVAVDLSGNIYVSNSGPSTIVKVNTSGVRTVIAGGGGSTYTTDGVAATTIRLCGQNDVAVDNAGNVYLTNYGCYHFLKVTPAGLIYNVAGNSSPSYSGDCGPATTANIEYPYGICPDNLGNVYVCPEGNIRVRRVEPTGYIYTVAGNGVSGYTGDGGPAINAEISSGIYGVYADLLGNVYFADAGNNCIRTFIALPFYGDTTSTSMCVGNTIALSNATSGGAWSSNNTAVATVNATSGAVKGIMPGLATISYFSSGCPEVVHLTVNPPPAISGGYVCVGSMITLSSSSSGGTWGSSNVAAGTVTSSGVVTGVAPGSTIITFTSSPGCSATTTLTVISPTSTISGGVPICIGDATTLSDTIAGGYWSSGTPAVATVGTGTGIVTGVSGGAAVISYFTVSGCTPTLIITVNPPPPAITGIENLCLGTTTALSDASPGGTWNSYNSLIVGIGFNTGIVTGNALGNTIITYTLPTGCFTTATISVSPPPSAINGNMAVCTFATIILSDQVSGGYWSSASPGIATVVAGTGIVTGVSGGLAILSYATGIGCFATATVTVNTAPATIAGNENICLGGTATLSDSPSGGMWTSSNTTVATISSNTGFVTSNRTGSTIITYTLPTSCYTSATVNVNLPPSVITGRTAICAHQTTALSNQVSGGVWSSSNTNIATISPIGVVTGITAGNVAISYSTGGICVVSIIVTVNPAPAAITGIENICSGGATTLSNSTTGGTWSSSNTSAGTIGLNNGYITGTSAGATTITYTLSTGCYITTTVTINLPPSAITGNETLCTFYTTQLSDQVNGGVWNSGNTTVATVGPTGIVTGIASGSAVITYTTGGICIVSTTVMVNNSPGPGTISGNQALCVNDSIILSDAVAGGIWSCNDTILATIIPAGITAGTLTGISAGSVMISYTVTDSCGTGTATTIITINPYPVIEDITGPVGVCTGAVISLSDNTMGGTWNSGNAAVATVLGGIVSGINTGLAAISYAVTNSCGTTTITKDITVYSLPPAGSITGITSVCKGAVITLSDNVAGGTWASSNTSVAFIDTATDSIRALTAGTTLIYYSTGPDSNGCTNVTTFTFIVSATPDFTISHNTTPPTCHADSNGSIVIMPNGGMQPFSYLWSNRDTTYAITGLLSGIYAVTVTELFTQCIAADTIYIPQPDSLITASVVTNDMCHYGKGTISLAVTGGTAPYTYVWSDNKTGKDISGLLATTYSVTITDDNHCTMVFSDTVGEDSCYTIIVHNAITPNGDGINDIWIIEGLDRYPDNTVQIFDKWGDLMYEKTNYQNDWSGKGKSGPLPDGTYYYLVKLNAPASGGKNTFTGALLIKR